MTLYLTRFLFAARKTGHLLLFAQHVSTGNVSLLAQHVYAGDVVCAARLRWRRCLRSTFTLATLFCAARLRWRHCLRSTFAPEEMSSHIDHLQSELDSVKDYLSTHQYSFDSAVFTEVRCPTMSITGVRPSIHTHLLKNQKESDHFFLVHEQDEKNNPIACSLFVDKLCSTHAHTCVVLPCVCV